MNTQTPEDQARLDDARAALHALIDKAFDTTDVSIVAVIYHNEVLATHAINFDEHEVSRALEMALRSNQRRAPLVGLAAAQSEGTLQ